MLRCNNLKRSLGGAEGSTGGGTGGVLVGYCRGTGGSTGGGELLLIAPVHPLKQSPTHLFNPVTVNESIFSQVKGREGVRSPAKHNTS